MAPATILLLMFGVLPPQAESTETHVGLVEVNHVFSSEGHLALDQVIWLSWNHAESRFDVRDWRLLKNVRAPLTRSQVARSRRGAKPPPIGKFIGGHATPRREGDRWLSEWWDTKDRKWRRVWAKQYRETWTAYDPEVQARMLLSQEKRRRLP